MIRSILHILFFVAISTWGYAHDYYMSVTKGNYNNESQMMECSMKVTAHDLENAIRALYGKAFDLDDNTQLHSQNELLKKYLLSKIEIMIDGKYIDLEYVGFELELNEDLWIYFQFKAPDQTFEYKNNILTELFAMQQNVTHFKSDRCEKSFVFTKNQSLEKFECND
ncbi:MAG: hypothetical protein H6599_01425 [Flavobacteriales bacterium]|nr:hypothetical protein [Flavobacteriales bacterium]